MIFCDSHAHLDFPDFEKDLEQVMARAAQAGVGPINAIGTRLEGVGRLLDIARSWPQVYVTVGVHPHWAAESDVASGDLVALAGSHAKVIAIGEAGLDFHYDRSPRDRQEAVFRQHIRAAHQSGLPLVVHTREAEAETRRIFDEEGVPSFGGVIHCFTGSPELAAWALEKGFHISFSGILTFKSAESLRRTAADVPLERLLIETDSPYLTPAPGRGGRNEPARVVQVAETLARVKGLPLAEIAEATSQNCRRLFRYDAVDSGPSRERLAYSIGRGLYLNVTRACTLHCAFCPKWTAPIVHDYDLTLNRNPQAAELIAALGDLDAFDEVVFCGYGEPTLRLPVILEVAAEVKRRGKRVRLNTDGLANRVYKRDVTPEFNGLIDAVSVSLNAQNEAVYNRHCQPALEGSYQSVRDFLLAVKSHVPDVTATAIDGLDGVDIDACQRIAEGLGVKFRARIHNRVG